MKRWQNATNGTFGRGHATSIRYGTLISPCNREIIANFWQKYKVYCSAKCKNSAKLWNSLLKSYKTRLSVHALCNHKPQDYAAPFTTTRSTLPVNCKEHLPLWFSHCYEIQRTTFLIPQHMLLACIHNILKVVVHCAKNNKSGLVVV